MSTDQQSAFDTEIEAIRDMVTERRSVWLEMSSAEELRSMELEAAELGRRLADAITEEILRQVLADPAFVAVVLAAALNGGRKMRRSGSAKHTISLLGGRQIEVKVPYLRPDRRSKPGPKRKPGQRGKGGVGMRPTLEALGIRWNTTPALQGEVMRQVAASESFRPALEALQARGIDLGYKQTLRLVHRFGQGAVSARTQWVQAIERGEVVPSDTLASKRVIVSPDGGRTRLRAPKTRGRRRKSGHRGFDTPWAEPKLFVIYVIDSNGKLESTFRPAYDATLGDADAMFELLFAYLWALGAANAECLVVLGDGARWIWERAPKLAARLGLPLERLTQVVDKYHAVEYLGETAKQAGSDGNADPNWLRRAKQMLDNGDAEGVAWEIELLGEGIEDPEFASRADYFLRNADRMRYPTFKRQGIPIGSGAAESAIRRVVNLKMKGNGKFWLAEHAEAMLMMRCYLKCGRFDDFINWVQATATPWWHSVQYLSPLGADGTGPSALVQAAA